MIYSADRQSGREVNLCWNEGNHAMIFDLRRFFKMRRKLLATLSTYLDHEMYYVVMTLKNSLER